MLPDSEFHDFHLQEVEEQLRADAVHFAKTVPAPEFVSEIIAEHTRRRRRRVHWRVATSAAACLLIVGLAFMVKPFWNLKFRMSSPGPASDIVRERIASVQQSSIVTGANPKGRESSIVTEKYETEMLWSPSSVAGTPPSAHVPVLIISMDAQGQPMKVSNVPVPSRIETVRLEDLSQPLRQAAYMVLDIEEHSPAQPEL
jgi:hypothetical protein